MRKWSQTLSSFIKRRDLYFQAANKLAVFYMEQMSEEAFESFNMMLSKPPSGPIESFEIN